MLFVIDVGNSHTVTGLYDGDKLVGRWRLKSDRKITDDELAIRYHSLFDMEGIDTRKISGVVLASVVPTLESAWISCCKKHFFSHLAEPILAISDSNVNDMLSIMLPNPSEIGADRLVNAIAAFERHQCNLVIVDFGTAITFDCVNAQNEYLGGAILPGVAISLDALATRTAKLPHIDVSKPAGNVIGTSTVEAMQSGILYGYGAMLDGMIAGIRKEMSPSVDQDFRVIATGGMAKLISPYARSIDYVDPLLTLDGLRLIYNRKQAV